MLFIRGRVHLGGGSHPWSVSDVACAAVFLPNSAACHKAWSSLANQVSIGQAISAHSEEPLRFLLLDLAALLASALARSASFLSTT